MQMLILQAKSCLSAPPEAAMFASFLFQRSWFAGSGYVKNQKYIISQRRKAAKEFR
jgi:hypothetical protein